MSSYLSIAHSPLSEILVQYSRFRVSIKGRRIPFSRFSISNPEILDSPRSKSLRFLPQTLRILQRPGSCNLSQDETSLRTCREDASFVPGAWPGSLSSPVSILVPGAGPIAIPWTQLELSSILLRFCISRRTWSPLSVTQSFLLFLNLELLPQFQILAQIYLKTFNSIKF